MFSTEELSRSKSTHLCCEIQRCLSWCVSINLQTAINWRELMKKKYQLRWQRDNVTVFYLKLFITHLAGEKQFTCFTAAAFWLKSYSFALTLGWITPNTKMLSDSNFPSKRDYINQFDSFVLRLWQSCGRIYVQSTCQLMVQTMQLLLRWMLCPCATNIPVLVVLLSTWRQRS